MATGTRVKFRNSQHLSHLTLQGMKQGIPGPDKAFLGPDQR